MVLSKRKSINQLKSLLFKMSTIVLRVLFFAVLVLTINWGRRTYEFSGAYLKENIQARLFGELVSGKIISVSKSTTVMREGNFTARVGVRTPDGVIAESDFRYAQPTFAAPEVRIKYIQGNPFVASLLDDAGYFELTMKGIVGIGGFCVFLMLVISFLQRKMSKIT